MIVLAKLYVLLFSFIFTHPVIICPPFPSALFSVVLSATTQWRTNAAPTCRHTSTLLCMLGPWVDCVISVNSAPLASLKCVVPCSRLALASLRSCRCSTGYLSGEAHPKDAPMHPVEGPMCIRITHSSYLRDIKVDMQSTTGLEVAATSVGNVPLKDQHITCAQIPDGGHHARVRTAEVQLWGKESGCGEREGG